MDPHTPDTLQSFIGKKSFPNLTSKGDQHMTYEAMMWKTNNSKIDFWKKKNMSNLLKFADKTDRLTRWNQHIFVETTKQAIGVFSLYEEMFWNIFIQINSPWTHGEFDSVYERLYHCPGLRMSAMSKSSKALTQASQRHSKSAARFKRIKRQKT